MLPIYVINNFGQFNHLIHRSLRDLDIDAALVPNSLPAEQVGEECRGIILGGGPALERTGNAANYLDLGLPVLGICLGLHIIAIKYGGSVNAGHSGGYGPVEVEISEHDDILLGYPKVMNVWASHADEVTRIPTGPVHLWAPVAPRGQPYLRRKPCISKLRPHIAGVLLIPFLYRTYILFFPTMSHRSCLGGPIMFHLTSIYN
jgi:GMP synthase (glutamine-hydrolysing)